MTIWLLLLFAVIISANPKETQYECGEHGRFEYCIDGIPGCVIGCHCHPGYYFDTDTKICEPNSNLLETYRRRYAAEPTRISQMDLPELMVQTPPPAPNVIDDHVDNIAKNTDDLGDWLYNQFYKTIETQVINNTNENNNTRRSGNVGNPGSPTTKKRRKSDKRGSSKKKFKQDDLRRKLLRITEDDSLFDSSSETDSSDASSTSKEDNKSDNKGHGHKKFVIVNKKPKPPLPSFVFLPNIETPFYPPIALPPPVLPMYPMVPVPPVLPGFPLPHVLPECDEKSSTPALPSSPATATATETATASIAQTSLADTTTDIITTVITTASQEPGALRKSKKKKMMMYNGRMDPLRRLRQLVQNSEQNTAIQEKTKVDPIEETDQSSTELQDALQIEPFANAKLQHRPITKSPLMDNEIADFKYLSELIHRVNLNDSDKTLVPRLKPIVRSRKPLIINQIKSRYPIMPPKIEKSSRRFDIEPYLQETKTADETFYSKLGKQIASLIRGVDSKNNRQIDIEIEHLDQNTASYPIFSELSYAPHSYWERFARSPKNYLEQYRRKQEHSRKSNENLNNIEDRVEMLASTMIPLSLQEIENFIKGIPESEDDVQDPHPQKYHQFYNRTLNVNLWPEEPPSVNVVPYHAIPMLNKSPPHSNFAKKNTSENRSQIKGFRMQNVYTTWVDREHSLPQTPANKIKNVRIENISDDKIKKIVITKVETPISKNQNKKLNYGKFPVRQYTLTPTRRSHKATVLKSLSPFGYNKKFVDHNNPFYHKTEDFKYPFENSLNKLFKSKRPSYFHHEVHHFNYID